MRGVIFITILSLLLTVPGYAKPKKAGKHHGSRNIEVTQSDLFSPAERHRIRSYLTNQQRRGDQTVPRNLPYGLQKKMARGKALPPGWQKKLASGDNLDYQIYRQGLPLPSGLLDLLPPAPAGSEIIQVDDSIIRVHTASRTILDFFNLIQSAQ